jgi:hypothetical protein
VARTAAREPGRLAGVERLEAAVGGAIDDFGSRGGRSVLRSMRAWYVEGIEEKLGPRLETGWRAAREELTAVLTTHLVVEAVADLLPDWVVRLGQGLVLAAFAAPGVAPDARWQCGPVVDRAVSDLVARTPVPALAAAAAAWDAVYWQEAGVLPLVVTTWSSAGCSRPVFELLDPARREDAARMLWVQGHELETLQIWLTSLATVLTERASLDPQVVELFLQAGQPVPGLEQLVNSPLTTDAP